MTKEEMAEIAKMIAKELQKVYVTETDISAMCGFARGSMPVREMLASPGFPQAIRFSEKGHRHYLKKDVIAYLEDLAHENAKMILSTLRL